MYQHENWIVTFPTKKRFKDFLQQSGRYKVYIISSYADTVNFFPIPLHSPNYFP